MNWWEDGIKKNISGGEGERRGGQLVSQHDTAGTHSLVQKKRTDLNLHLT